MSQGNKIRIAAGFVIAVILVAVGLQVIGRRIPHDSAPSANPEMEPITIRPLDLLNETRLRELAKAQNISLPPDLKISPPSGATPVKVTKYLGAWSGEGRWSRDGRQAILVVESVSSAGTALGIYAHGPPFRPDAPNQRPGQFTTFIGNITEQGLGFAWGQSKYRFTIAPDDSIRGLWQNVSPQGTFDLTITLNRVR